MYKIVSFAGLLAIVPAVALAQTRTLGDLLGLFSNIINAMIPFFIALAGLLFLYGVLKMVMAGDDEEARKAGRGTMIYGVIALFVMVSVWGLVALLVNTFNLDTAAPDVPVGPEIEINF